MGQFDVPDQPLTPEDAVYYERLMQERLDKAEWDADHMEDSE